MLGCSCQRHISQAAKLNKGGSSAHLLSRRALLKSALGVGLSLYLVELAAGAERNLRRKRPQAGDRFVFSFGDREGQTITPEDLPLGGPPAMAYPMDPETQVVRDGSRLNRVLLVRFAQKQLTERTRVAAVEGIVGYSAICTHTGCDVSEWNDTMRHFVCPCHSSAFDPKDRARVLNGPAPKPLAVLPLQVVDGVLTAAGPFSSRVGFKRR